MRSLTFLVVSACLNISGLVRKRDAVLKYIFFHEYGDAQRILIFPAS